MTLLAPSLISDAWWTAITPSEPMRHADWLRERYYTHEGKPFDEYMVPHVTAPGGPCEAVDNPQVRIIALQWAARMFKTTFGQSVQMRYADLDPCSMMFATGDQELCKTIFGRFWRMLEHCPSLRDQCPPEHLQSKMQIALEKCTIYGAWARGKTKLADKPVRIGHGNEVDKWEHLSTATEGDPLPRFLKRGAEYPDRKFIIESTPSEKLRSRIENLRLKSSNCKYYVPCPHCAKFQVLTKGNGSEGPGVYWDKDASGRNNPDLAYKTAHYVCQHCEGKVENIHRAEMMNLGVWVPEGCGIDHDRAMKARDVAPDDRSWLTGEPLRDGQSYGSQISALYFLADSWGDIAMRYLNAVRKPQELRQYINEDLAETWEIAERKENWEDIGKRIILPGMERGIVPIGFSSVTIGIDKQKSHYVYSVDAWAPGQRSHTVQYGIIQGETDEAMEGQLDALLSQSWPHADGGDPVRLAMALEDSGFFPKGVGKFVARMRRKGIPIMACKGSSTKLPAVFTKNVQGAGSAMPGQVLVMVDTAETQDWIEDIVLRIKPDEPSGHSIHAGTLAEHEGYLEQIQNDAPVDSLDTKNNVQIAWKRIDDSIPNDLRDTERYNFAAMNVRFAKGNIPPRVTERIDIPVQRARFTTPDGRPFLITERTQ